MEMHRPQGDKAFHDMRNARPVIMAVDGLERRLIRRLDAHFQLDPSFRCLGQEVDVVIGKDARLDFQVEIDGLIDGNHVRYERPVMGRAAVESAVDEFDLMDAGIDESLQFLQDQRDRAEADAVVHARQAVLAVERTAPGAFIIHDAVVQFAEVLMLVRKRQAVQVFYFLEGLVALDDAADAAEDAGDFCPIAAGCQGFQESRYHLFPFTLEDVIDMLIIFQYLPGRIGYFRAADEDLGLGKDLFHQVDEMTGHFDIPDIAGKADDVGLERGDVAQDVIAVLIDRIFGYGHGDALVVTHRRQAAQGQGRLDEFGIQDGKQCFHESLSLNFYMY